PDRIYYTFIDTLITIMGVTKLIKYLSFEEKSDSNSLQVTFSEVGQNKGEYQLIQSNANGRIYKWVGTDINTGLPLGSYAPYRILIAPRNQTITSVGLEYINKNEDKAAFKFETSLSSLDLNRLSHVNDEDNIGIAGIVQAKAPAFIWKKLKWTNEGSFEINDKKFIAINPYRNPEFNRNWNIDSQTGFNDRLLNLKSKVQVNSALSSNLQFSQFKRDLNYKGNKYEAIFGWQDSVNDFRIKFDLLKTDLKFQSTQYFRPGIYLSRKILKHFTIGAIWEQEKNERKDTLNQSLLPSSFNFMVYNSYIKFQTIKDNFVKLDWKKRIDQNIANNKLSPFSISDEYTLSSQINSIKAGNWDVAFTVRNLQFNDNKVNDSLGQNYFLGQLDHSINFKKNAIRFKTIYALQSGAEPRTEYIYEERRPGEGNFIYMDFNHDGIRQIQEYVQVPSSVDTAKYVRIQLFNSEYVQAYQSSITSIIGFDLGRILSAKKPNNIWKKFSYESLLRFVNKINPNSSLLDRFNPFLGNNKSSLLITFQKNINQQLFFNRSSPRYELSTSYIAFGNQLLLVSGLEKREKKELNTKARWTMLGKLDWMFIYSIQQDIRSTEFYTLQNYLVQSNSYDLSGTLRINRNVRVQLGSKIKNSTEQNKHLESAFITEFYTQSQMAWKNKLSLRLEVRYFKISYIGMPGTAVEYVILDGKKDGNNYQSEISIDYRISKLISSQFSYSFLKSSSSDPIHTARISMRANF
ncbi:MAG: hypothetical protein ABIO44_13760, partial [Saprospiraceae bacterium]